MVIPWPCPRPLYFLRFSRVGEVFAARLRPRGCLLSTMKCSARLFGESCMVFRKVIGFVLKLWSLHDSYEVQWSLHGIHGIQVGIVIFSWFFYRNWWFPGHAPNPCISLGFSSVGEVFAARLRPRGCLLSTMKWSACLSWWKLHDIHTNNWICVGIVKFTWFYDIQWSLPESHGSHVGIMLFS